MPSGPPLRASCTATGWVARLQEAHSRGKPPAEIARLRRNSLLIVDEVGLRGQEPGSRSPHWSVGSNLPDQSFA